MWYFSIKPLHLLFLSQAITFAISAAGIETKFKQRHFKVLVSPAFVKELREVAVTQDGLQFGASVTLTDMERHLRKAVDTFPGWF